MGVTLIISRMNFHSVFFIWIVAKQKLYDIITKKENLFAKGRKKMFAYIKGKLESKSVNYIVIEVGGAGFKIFMSEPSIQKLGQLGQEVKVHTHFQVREDDMSLYGFISKEELRMFELLLSVSGIGAKSAITMLSSITPSSFALAVISNDVKRLTKVQGVGLKTAQRIVLELKDKLKTQQAIGKIENDQLEQAIQKDNETEETIAALKVLGYCKTEIETVLEKLPNEGLSVEERIKKALTYLGK